MNKKYYKIIQIQLIVISMLAFLGAHLLTILNIYMDKPIFFGSPTSINLVMDTSLTIGFIFLFVVIVIIMLDLGDEIKTTEYIEFKLVEKLSKTNVYAIKTRPFGLNVGYIKWSDVGFKKYCFFPESGTVFDTKCLITIIDFIEKLTKNYEIKKVK